MWYLSWWELVVVLCGTSMYRIDKFQLQQYLSLMYIEMFFKHANEKNTQLWYYMCEDNGFAIERPHKN